MCSTDKKIFFISDLHLGIPDDRQSLEREKMLVRWLDSIKNNAQAIYLMGDLFDFWFEYGTVVPKGYVRFLGKLTELVDSGIEVHYYIGNHDLWQFGYLENIVGLIRHDEAETITLLGHRFHLVHGDGKGPGDRGYKFLRKVFTNKINQFLFKWLHPDIGMRLALHCSNKSRVGKVLHGKKNHHQIQPQELSIYKYAEDILLHDKDIEYFIFGHVHKPTRIKMNDTTEFVIIGDWIEHFSYVEFDGEQLIARSLER